MSFKELRFIKCRILEIIAVHLINFFYIKSARSHHVRDSSRTIPMNVIFLTCLMFSLFRKIFISYLGFLFFDLKRMNLVFVVFIESLLTFSQSVSLFISI